LVVASRRGGLAGRLGVRGLVVLGVLVPLVGLAALAGRDVADRLAGRDASTSLQAATDELQEAVTLRAEIATEEIGSTVLGLVQDAERDQLTVTGFDQAAVRAELVTVRDAVDRHRTRWSSPGLDAALAELDALRDRLDGGDSGRRDVADTFAAVNAGLAAQWAEQMAEIESIADRTPLTGDIRARLRTLRETVGAFEHAGPRVNAALQILLDAPTPEAIAALVDTTARFQVAAEQAGPLPGTAADRAWQAFADDPAVARLEAILTQAANVAAGGPPPWAELDVGLLAAGLDDGRIWGAHLVALVEAATADLSEAAGARADADAAGVRTEALRAGLLVALSLLGALLTARSLVRPAVDLEVAARRVQAGEFDLPPVPVRGPREMTATVTAFNDMAATLAAVEDHTVALAEDPDSIVLDEPLPGRTGQAMQAAIDHLRNRMADAETHRAELHQAATHDGLTGLLNRSAAYVEVERELARAARDGQRLLAMYVDLDGLKALNDTHGHQAGDEAIVRTAEALAATTRAADIVARLGGDEFVVVGPVPPGGPDAIAAFAQRVHGAVGHQRVTVDDGTGIGLRCSVGVALSGVGVQTAEQLVRAADSAMYRAKVAGRDRVDVSDLDLGPDPQLV
jgi:diguanylate cyclase (GGDEF)-like protein